jgi:hypothetical protein
MVIMFISSWVLLQFGCGGWDFELHLAKSSIKLVFNFPSKFLGYAISILFYPTLCVSLLPYYSFVMNNVITFIALAYFLWLLIGPNFFKWINIWIYFEKVTYDFKATYPYTKNTTWIPFKHMRGQNGWYSHTFWN